MVVACVHNALSYGSSEREYEFEAYKFSFKKIT
jgi:hypothetical protein